MLGYVYQLQEGLGTFNIGTDLTLLSKMKLYSLAVMFIGLIFMVLLLIFIVISCLLIYSLLLISVETKAFEVGVMRLVGLTKCSFVAMIMTQASLFVIPSLILGFAAAIPCILAVEQILLSDGINDLSILPGWTATLEALALGLFIPTISAIIPIRRALQRSLA